MIAKWTDLGKVLATCSLHIIGKSDDDSCWKNGFNLFKELVLEERKSDESFGKEVASIDVVTDYEYNIQEWLEDYRGLLASSKDYQALLEVCDDLLLLFDWPSSKGNDLRMKKALALSKLERYDEAVEFARQWNEDQPNNVMAKMATINVYMVMEEYDKADEVVQKLLSDGLECDTTTYPLFKVASKLYKYMHKPNEKKKIDKICRAYERKLGSLLFGGLFGK